MSKPVSSDVKAPARNLFAVRATVRINYLVNYESVSVVRSFPIGMTGAQVEAMVRREISDLYGGTNRAFGWLAGESMEDVMEQRARKPLPWHQPGSYNVRLRPALNLDPVETLRRAKDAWFSDKLVAPEWMDVA